MRMKASPNPGPRWAPPDEDPDTGRGPPHAGRPVGGAVEAVTLRSGVRTAWTRAHKRLRPGRRVMGGADFQDSRTRLRFCTNTLLRRGTMTAIIGVMSA